MKSLNVLLVMMAALVLSGCLFNVDPKVEPKPECLVNCNPEPEEKPALKGTFVSGHLGSYWDCPDEAYNPDPEVVVGGANEDGAFAEGDCAEGQECIAILNCERAQAIVRLTNGGDANGEGVALQKIELLNTLDEVVAELPVISVQHSDIEEPFDGIVSTEDAVNLRVEFQGPLNPYEMLSVEDAANSRNGDQAFGSSGIGFLRLTFSADNHADVIILSTEVYGLPSVDT